MTEPSKNALGLTGFPTPYTAADVSAYLLFLFPDPTWAQYILGACENLCTEYNWYEAGDLLPEEASEAFRIIVQQAPYNLMMPEEVPTPFWDNEDDVDDEETPELQPWYGEVTNPTAPADELDFVENVLLWGFTGLIALATIEVGAAPAILFHTTVKKFIITQKRGDVGETIRFVVDNQDFTTIDTTPYPAGSLIETTVVTNQEDGDHVLMLIGEPS